MNIRKAENVKIMDNNIPGVKFPELSFNGLFMKVHKKAVSPRFMILIIILLLPWLEK